MLYLVGTPIGNLEDITLRALRVLKEADIIACEDTRNTQKLLNHYEVKGKKLLSYHEHNEDKMSDKIIEYLEEGLDIALVTDAGMPCISDPGYVLVEKVKTAGLDVVALPGANAGLTALVASGIESYNYTFYGFLPRKSKELKQKLEIILNLKTTGILYESPHRVKNLVEEIAKIAPTRKIAVARELTKMFEQIETYEASVILDMLGGEIKEKGEFVVIISPSKDEEITDLNLDDIVEIIYQKVQSGEKKSEAIKNIAKKYGIECKAGLTGFKWIGKMIREAEGKQKFVCGGEESFGFMTGDFVRDKDSCGSILLACEIAAWCKAQGSSVFQYMIEIYKDLGLYQEALVNVVRKGREGAEEIKKMMSDFRNNPVKELAGSKVVLVKDFQEQTAWDLVKDEKAEMTDIPKSNVLIYYTEDGTKVAIRPSGTEPKIKFYFSVKSNISSESEYAGQVDKLNHKIEQIKKDLSL